MTRVDTATATAEREAAMAGFLAAAGWAGIAPVTLAADASFRRYFRLADDARRAVLMDAPPPVEDVRPFVAVADLLRGFGLSAPEIYAADPDGGFLLIEDFGDDLYTRLLAAGADEAALYGLAIDTLIALHRAVAASAPPALPPYDEARLIAEAALLVDWYMPSVLGVPLPAPAREDYLARWREILPQAALPSPTLVLRDYHVDNLILLPGRTMVRACGLLDFQDAVTGPASYDLVSLLEDARRDVPAALRAAMTERYLAAFPGLDRAQFVRSGAILAAQRNAKILGIFTRLWRRDGKPAYLPHIARVWRLLHDEIERETALGPIADWLDRHLPHEFRRRADRAGRGMIGIPETAMVLAAGLGTRMRPISDSVPKPLVEIGGRTLLDHAIDRLALVGVERVVVNVHYKAEMVRAQLAARERPRIEISHEADLLETGGGVARALPSLGEWFFVVNSDVLWLDSKDYALARLAAAFDPDRMDAVLLLQRTATAVGYEGSGDYFLDVLGTPRRRGEREIAPYLFTGVQLLHSRLFAGIAEPRYSLNRVYDRAERAGRLCGIVHDGEWYHVGTPEGLAATEARLSSHRIER